MGRPREFDVDEAIRVAGELFGARGYHATSISDLTEALGILRGSLYKAFPDKRSLLLTVLDRYRIAQLDSLRRNLSGDGAAARLRETLLDLTNGSPGTSIAGLTLELVPHDVVVTQRLIRHYQQVAEIFEEALCRMEAEGDLASGVSIPAFAQMLVVFMQGLAVTVKVQPPASVGAVEGLVASIVIDRSLTTGAG
jgi:TetR/AcrR family transcriptional repressor of nem operon